MFIVNDKIHCIKRNELSSFIITICEICLFVFWWLYIQLGLTYRCNLSVGVSCMRVLCMIIKECDLLELCVIKTYLTHRIIKI